MSMTLKDQVIWPSIWFEDKPSNPSDGHEIRAAEAGPYLPTTLVPELLTEFFQWFWNAPGTNTEQAAQEWWAKKLDNACNKTLSCSKTVSWYRNHFRY